MLATQSFLWLSSPIPHAVTRLCLRGDLVRELAKLEAFSPSINKSNHRRRCSFLLVCSPPVTCRTRKIHPRRSTACQLCLPAALPCPAAPSRPARLASSRPAPPRDVFFLGAGRSTAITDLAVAGTFQPISVFIKHTGVIVVSY